MDSWPGARDSFESAMEPTVKGEESGADRCDKYELLSVCSLRTFSCRLMLRHVMSSTMVMVYAQVLRPFVLYC